MAARIDGSFIDSDEVVTRRLGRSIADFWRDEGEAAFREVEVSAIAEIAAGPSCVVATGGGAILRLENVLAMRASGSVVWLDTDPKTLAGRIGAGNRRPLLAGQDALERLRQIHDERHDAYAAAATEVVATTGLSLETVVDRVVELWNAY